MSNRPIIPVVLCGGTGTRLWPLSRRTFPKQFLAIANNNKKSLLQNTILRVSHSEDFGEPILICNEEHRFIVAEQMREINVKPKAIILEPFGKNTGPSIIIAALKALEYEENPILLILSSDHIVSNKNEFIKVVKNSTKFAHKEKLVTFGVIPKSPHTGYGYIQAKSPLLQSPKEGKEIIRFIEKPNLEKAKKLYKDNHYAWNSGIFLFKAKTIINEFQNFDPNTLIFCKDAIKGNKIDLDFQRLNIDEFKKCPNVSIDIAIMEKTKNGIVLPLDAGWNDIGSWESVWESSTKNKDGNVLEGKIIEQDTCNCLMKSEKRLVVGIGLKDLVVIDTNDAVLIANKNESQKIKDIVNKLKQEGIKEGQENRTIFRPWGHYTAIVEDKRWQVKLISVKPGEKLSQQMHHHRSEHWIVVNGTAMVEVDERSEILSENQSIYIPLGAVHRLTNPGKIPLSLIEVQSGSYLGEDDITRFKDNYGRIENNDYNK